MSDRQASPLFSRSSSTTKAHYCEKREDDSGIWAKTRAWWLIPGHLICTMLFTISLLVLVDGNVFPVETCSYIQLNQSSVTTIVSAGLVVIRILTTTWQALAAWRCVFVLLEKSGLRLSQLTNLISWKWPIFSVRKYVLWSFFIIILTWPAQFVAPVASGSIKWVPTLNLLSKDPTNVIILSAQTTKFNQVWEWVQQFPASRVNLVDYVAGITSSISLVGSNNAAKSRRMISNTRPFTNGSTVGAVAVPYFSFKTFDWVSDPTKLSTGIQEAVLNDQSGYLNFASSTAALTQVVIGNAAVLKTTFFVPFASGQGLFPNATEYTNTQKYVAVFVARYNNYGVQVSTCASNVTTWFNVPNMKYLAINYNNNQTNCYAIASTTIDAGVATCEASIVSPMVVQCNEEPQAPESDPLIDLVFAMLPDVMEKVVALNLMHLDISGDVDKYTKNLVLQSYQGIWSGLTENFANTDEATTNLVYEPLLAVKAKVSKLRMYIWAALNGLLTLSGLLLALLQYQCNGKTVVDTVLAPIMLDISSVISRDRDGLCNAIVVNEKDDRKGSLRFRRSPEGTSRYHEALELDGQS